MAQTVEILETPAQAQPAGIALLDLAVTATPLVINWNRDAVSAILDSILEQYDGLVVQEEDVPAIKSEMAALNKLADKLDTARKDIKRQIGAPIADFETDVKAMTARVIEVRAGMDTQVKEFERREREGRRATVQFAIDSLKDAEKVPEIDIPIKEQWLNKSIKQAQLHAEIQNIIFKYKQEKTAAEQLERAKADRATMVETILKAKAEEYGFSLPMGKFTPCLSLNIASEEADNTIGQAFATEFSLREQQAKDKAAREAAAEEVRQNRQAVPTTPSVTPIIEDDGFPFAPPVKANLTLSVTYDPTHEQDVQKAIDMLRMFASVKVM